ncbi:TonB-dependent receptor [Thalassotalea litorea]|uniref:TonB-dependent receptor n=2 Tax=Thalassotalea litorea TaxID=2020715 RepID=A0A5R9IKC1_9GAMM|nr:TonB-dependent receptor [Thalassotalea litorea]
MYSNNKLAKAVRIALAFGASATAGISANAFAAEEAVAEEEVERIEVTGSRIKRTDMESASPVFITSAEEIKLSGFTRIEDLLNTLPQIEAGQTAFQSNGASGTANLDLRGMGPNRTLVLVNGRRLPSGGVYSQAPDINQIPAALVKRVEVLTGGASATYGADAVAGVVNFVMNDDFEGFELTVGASGYQHDNDNSYIQGLMDEKNFEYPEGNTGIDGKSYNIDLTVGGELGDKGHAVAYATWRRSDELRQEARDFSSCALSGRGNSCGGSGNAIVPNFYLGGVDADGAFDWGNWDYLTLTQDSNFQPSSGNLYNYAPVNHFMRPDEKFTLGAFVNYEVNEHFMPFLEFNYMHDRTVAQIAESGTFFNETYVLPVSQLNADQQQYLADNLGLTAADEFATYIGKRNVEGGPRKSNLEHNSYRIVVGTEGEISDSWSYEAFVNYGSTSSSAAYENDFFAPRIATAVDADACAADAACIFYDVFQYQGVTAESASSLTGVGILNGITTSSTVSGFVTGELPFGLPTADSPIAMVVGAEYRKEEFERLSDEVYAQGLLLGQGGPTTSIMGGYDVREIFAEASIPLLSDMFLAESLTLDLSGRYSDYDTSGGEPTYSTKVDWNITDDWKVRASYARAVRAPNIAELFAPQSQGLWGGADNCAGPTPKYTPEQCALTGVTAGQYGNITPSPASQYNGLFGGNPELQPEVADTVSFGVVANPLDSLNFTVDYWDIEVEDVIGTAGAQNTVDICAETGDAAYCDNVVRSGAGSLWLGTAGYVQATNINLSSMHFEGIDTTINFMQEGLLGGTLRANLNGTYMMKKEFDGVDCAGTIDNGCFAQPEWRHSAKVSYDMDTFWTASIIWRYYGEVSYSGLEYDDEGNYAGGDEFVGSNGGLDSASFIDLKAAFDVSDNLGVLVGVNNVFDKEPPMVGGELSTNANAVSGFYDTLGRYLHVSATLKF